MLLPASLVVIARLLPAPLYVVGGWVRNVLAYDDPKGTDIDVCSPLTPEEVRAALTDTPVKIVDVNPRIGTVLLSLEGDSYEYTAFREDSYPIGGVHTPDSVRFVKDVTSDAKRRDFRCNAVYWDVLQGVAVDPLDGRADIQARLIRCTRTPQEVFGEDGLRILRLVRLAARLGWDVHPDTLSTAYEMRDMLRDISWERRQTELDAILLADQAYGYREGLQKGLALLDRLQLWPYVFGFEPSEGAKRAACRIEPDADMRLAALLADKTPEEIVDSLSHRGLRYSNKRVQKVLDLVKGYRSCVEGEPLLLVAASAHLADTVKGVSDLLNAYDHPQLAGALLEREHRLLVEQVPLLPSQLPIEAKRLQQLGIPADKWGATLRHLVQEGVLRIHSLTAEECLALAADYKEKHLC